MDAPVTPRITLVHDWLTGMRGGEKCLEPLCRRWPHAHLLTLLHKPGSVSAAIERLRPRSSLLNYLPASHRYYRWLLPLMPAAIAAMRVPPSDLVVSFSHCVAKNIRVPRGTPHVCYCFTPIRYAWHLRESYFGDRVGGVKARLLDGFLHLLRQWDRHTAAGVTHFIADSETVRRRIGECYDRDAAVIYPPVDTDFYHPAPVPRADYYCAVSAFAPYKRLDLAVAACQRLGRSLVVIGSGQDADRLRSLAGPGIQFLGWQPDEVIRDHLRRCRALLFPGEEDFGIVPIEAMACGTPVIAFGRGGATETIVPHGGRREPTGLFFEEQTDECVADAIQRFENHANDFTSAAIRRQALRFNVQRYQQELFDYLDAVLRPAVPARRAA